MKQYDVIVVGGGPAGIFAAGFAAKQGAKVLLLEKNAECGKKILITGKGRCNVTHDEENPRKFVEAFGRNGKALLTALYAFGVKDVVDFFEQHGVPMKLERGGRIFPDRGEAKDIQRALTAFLSEAGVEVQSSCTVTGLTIEDDKVTLVKTDCGDFTASSVIVATGGLSYKETGCTGDGYEWAKLSGHSVIKPTPALVAVKLHEPWTSEVSRFNLKNVKVSLCVDGKLVDERFGEAFFTRGGIGGPIILDMSTRIRQAINEGEATLRLDLKPAVSEELFDKRLQREFTAHNNIEFGRSLGGLLPSDMIPIFLRLVGIDPKKKCHSV
ncbi:MAG: aminoacetone oxidase family FAD-binding enzyme, partial [Desulfuromonadales bacterium]|nr:aminoacetone oxidase family FAD-binding enzyme [Desulfuromonadales bacterium]